MVIAQNIVLGGMQEQEIRHIAINLRPSCYTLGYPICPTGHSQAFCNGYEYGSGGNGRGYVQGVTDATHCSQPGFPACYEVGFIMDTIMQ